MTVDQYIAKLNRQIEALERNDKALFLAASSVHGKMVTRIFSEGQTSAGAKIGNYNSTKPIYVNPKNAPKGFPAKGKNGQSTFKNGRKRKTGYFQSYKDFRGKQGRETAFVNLRLHGRLQTDFANSLQKSGNKYISGTKNAANTVKIEGNEKRFNAAIFRLTKAEHDLFINILSKELINQLK